MCGRATMTMPVAEVAEAFAAALPDHLPEDAPGATRRFNLSPGQTMLVVRRNRAKDGRELAALGWGLVPFWAESPKEGRRLAQARAETVEAARPFRAAFERRRCIVVIDGFYEWQAPPKSAGPKAKKTPYYVTAKAGGLLAVAGLWERWKSPDGEVLETCAVVTTKAVDAIARIHDRMPLLLADEEIEPWLAGSTDEAARIAHESRATRLELTPISTWVNDVRHDDARCIEPLGPATELPLKTF
jgi:putative SOS response-associated peptidase YedK